MRCRPGAPGGAERIRPPPSRRRHGDSVRVGPGRHDGDVEREVHREGAEQQPARHLRGAAHLLGDVVGQVLGRVDDTSSCRKKTRWGRCSTVPAPPSRQSRLRRSASQHRVHSAPVPWTTKLRVNRPQARRWRSRSSFDSPSSGGSPRTAGRSAQAPVGNGDPGRAACAPPRPAPRRGRPPPRARSRGESAGQPRHHRRSRPGCRRTSRRASRPSRRPGTPPPRSRPCPRTGRSTGPPPPRGVRAHAGEDAGLQLGDVGHHQPPAVVGDGCRPHLDGDRQRPAAVRRPAPGHDATGQEIRPEAAVTHPVVQPVPAVGLRSAARASCTVAAPGGQGGRASTSGCRLPAGRAPSARSSPGDGSRPGAPKAAHAGTSSRSSRPVARPGRGPRTASSRWARHGTGWVTPAATSVLRWTRPAEAAARGAPAPPDARLPAAGPRARPLGSGDDRAGLSSGNRAGSVAVTGCNGSQPVARPPRPGRRTRRVPEHVRG